MVVLIITLLGGIGLFLLGMSLLTEGLKHLAGEALRRTLVTFTGKPFKAFASGALVTLMIQSSSATTLMVIGFVSAGILAFPQAVGVVVGASLGTTGTCWIVSILGLRIQVGLYALPLVGVGAFLKLLARGRLEAFGTALAGFGLLFVGIDTLQQAMQGQSEAFHFSKWPAGGLLSHLLMMLVGAAMTVVMQSSSAANATTLTALHTGTIHFEQAASIVIGAAIGTTATSALASIGASTSAKRTALAHILFNLATGLIAVLLLPLFMRVIALAQQNFGLTPGAVSLAAFHTLFVSAGVAIVMPLIGPFSRWIERLLPDRGPSLTRHFDNSLLRVPTVALEATRRALVSIACELFSLVRTRLTDQTDLPDSAEQSIQLALERTQQFMSEIPPLPADEPMSQSRVAQLHAIDHLVRLQSHMLISPSLCQMLAHERLQSMRQLCLKLIALAIAGLEHRGPDDWLEIGEQKAKDLTAMRRQQRPSVFKQSATGDWQPDQALKMLDAMRWLERVGKHVWRISYYLSEERSMPTSPAENEKAES
jgi:phosphate:Na+ symporter